MNERKNKALMGADSECKMEDGGWKSGRERATFSLLPDFPLPLIASMGLYDLWCMTTADYGCLQIDTDTWWRRRLIWMTDYCRWLTADRYWYLMTTRLIRILDDDAEDWLQIDTDTWWRRRLIRILDDDADWYGYLTPFSLYSLWTDRKENTASNNLSIVAHVSVASKRVYRAVT
jgi:hypothetical protein